MFLFVVLVMIVENCLEKLSKSVFVFELNNYKADLAVLMFVISRLVYKVFTVFISELLSAFELL